MTRAIRDYDEQTVHTRWRRVVCWAQRAGACRAVKRRSNRRDRHQARHDLRTHQDD